MEKLFMENGYISLNKYGEQLCGDRVEVKNNPSGDFTMVLADGLECLPAGLEILSAGPEGSEGLVTLREGKFHQVKRMLAARGKPVLYLKRVRMGNLPLDPALEPGTYRYLTEDEVESLRNF